MNKNKEQFEVKVERNIFRNGLDLFILDHERNIYTIRQVPDVEPVTASEESLFLTLEAGQNLMDELWRAGLRPLEVGSVGQLAATEKHLEDMRTLVAAQTKIPLPGVKVKWVHGVVPDL